MLNQLSTNWFIWCSVANNYEEESQDFVDLSHETEPLQEMAESACSVFSFDSDLFSPSDVDKDVANEEHCSDVADVSEVSDEDKERDHHIYTQVQLLDEGIHNMGACYIISMNP